MQQIYQAPKYLEKILALPNTSKYSFSDFQNLRSFGEIEAVPERQKPEHNFCIIPTEEQLMDKPTKLKEAILSVFSRQSVENEPSAIEKLKNAVEKRKAEFPGEKTIDYWDSMYGCEYVKTNVKMITKKSKIGEIIGFCLGCLLERVNYPFIVLKLTDGSNFKSHWARRHAKRDYTGDDFDEDGNEMERDGNFSSNQSEISKTSEVHLGLAGFDQFLSEFQKPENGEKNVKSEGFDHKNTDHSDKLIFDNSDNMDEDLNNSNLDNLTSLDDSNLENLDFAASFPSLTASAQHPPHPASFPPLLPSFDERNIKDSLTKTHKMTFLEFRDSKSYPPIELVPYRSGAVTQLLITLTDQMKHTLTASKLKSGILFMFSRFYKEFNGNGLKILQEKCDELGVDASWDPENYPFVKTNVKICTKKAPRGENVGICYYCLKERRENLFLYFRLSDGSNYKKHVQTHSGYKFDFDK